MRGSGYARPVATAPDTQRVRPLRGEQGHVLYDTRHTETSRPTAPHPHPGDVPVRVSLLQLVWACSLLQADMTPWQRVRVSRELMVIAF